MPDSPVFVDIPILADSSQEVARLGSLWGDSAEVQVLPCRGFASKLTRSSGSTTR